MARIGQKTPEKGPDPCEVDGRRVLKGQHAAEGLKRPPPGEAEVQARPFPCCPWPPAAQGTARPRAGVQPGGLPGRGGTQGGWQDSPRILAPVSRGRVRVPPFPGKMLRPSERRDPRVAAAGRWAAARLSPKAVAPPSSPLLVWERSGLGPGSCVRSGWAHAELRRWVEPHPCAPQPCAQQLLNLCV